MDTPSRGHMSPPFTNDSKRPSLHDPRQAIMDQLFDTHKAGKFA